MIYTYRGALEKYKTSFQVQKAVKKGKLTKLSRGIYTSSDEFSNFDYVVKKYPKVIFTMNSAFYYLGLTEKKPLKYHLATSRTSLRIKDDNVEQYFQIDKFLSLGVIKKKVNSRYINIYNKERMLIELIRLKNRLDPSYYEEIIHNYYLRKEELNITKLNNYINKFKMRKYLVQKIYEELDMDLC